MVITYTLLSLTVLGLYVVIGYSIARIRLPWMWKTARRLHNYGLHDSVKEQFVFTMSIWPLYVPISFTVQGFFAARKWFRSGPNNSLRRPVQRLGIVARHHLDELVERSAS